MVGVDVMVRKKKYIFRDESIVVYVPADSDVGVDVADAISEGRSIAKNRSNTGHDTEAPVFAQARSSQGTGDVQVFGHEKSDVAENPYGAIVAGKFINPVSNEKTGEAAGFRS